jgi:hypothetical protein
MYPFFYFYDLDFDAEALLTFANSIPESEWLLPRAETVEPGIDLSHDPHPGDHKLWTANATRTNFFASEEIQKIAKYFTAGKFPLFRNIMMKKSINGFKPTFRPLMQNEEYDKKRGIVRTFDIIVPIQGGFKESPLEAIDTKTNEHYILIPKGKAFMVPNDPTWHFTWMETVYDYRYTLHLRGLMPVTYDNMKKIYFKNSTS